MNQETPSKGSKKLYWYSNSDRTHGPVIGSELKRLAREGVLCRDAAVWQDGSSRVVVAEKIPRLFDGVTATSQSASQGPEPIADGCDRPEDIICFPILRTEKRWLSNAVFAIYEDHILYGRRYFGELNISESDCLPDGEKGLAEKLWKPTQIPNDDVSCIFGHRRTSNSSQLTICTDESFFTVSLSTTDCLRPLQHLATTRLPQFRISKWATLDRFCSLLLAGKLFLWLFAFFFLYVPSSNVDNSTRELVVHLGVVSLITGTLYLLLMLQISTQLNRWSTTDRAVTILVSSINLLLLVVAQLATEEIQLVLLLFNGLLCAPELYTSWRIWATEATVRVSAPTLCETVCKAPYPLENKDPQAFPKNRITASASHPDASSGQLEHHDSIAIGLVLKLLGIAYCLAINSSLTRQWTDGLQAMNYSVSPMIWFVLNAPAPALIYLGYRVSLVSWDRRKSKDPRRSILFLRPFVDDASISLQPRGILASLSGVDRRPFSFSKEQGLIPHGRTSLSSLCTCCHPMRLFRLLLGKSVDTSEESLAAFFRKYGPVRAIGRPGEFAPIPGAARTYVGDDWKSHVAMMVRESQMILIQPGISEGVAWELRHLRAKCDPSRVLFCLAGFTDSPGDYEKLRNTIRRTMSIVLPRVVPFAKRPCFVTFDSKWHPSLHILSYRNPLLWPLLGDAVDLQYTLAPFVNGIEGGERQPPRAPRWTRNALYIPAAICAGVLSVAILSLPSILIDQLESLWADSFSSQPETKRPLNDK